MNTEKSNSQKKRLQSSSFIILYSRVKVLVFFVISTNLQNRANDSFVIWKVLSRREYRVFPRFGDIINILQDEYN